MNKPNIILVPIGGGGGSDKAISGDLVTSDDTTVTKYLVDIEIPEGITTIEENAFFSMEVGTLTLPESMSLIKNQAFWSGHINEIVCHAVNPPQISAKSFAYVNAIYVPAESVSAYKSAQYWAGFASVIQPISE